MAKARALKAHASGSAAHGSFIPAFYSSGCWVILRGHPCVPPGHGPASPGSPGGFTPQVINTIEGNKDTVNLPVGSTNKQQNIDTGVYFYIYIKEKHGLQLF